MTRTHSGVGRLPGKPLSHPPFAWSLSSWLADFFQSSMRSCSGLMRLSSSALRAGEGVCGVYVCNLGYRGPSVPACQAHSLGELPQFGLDAAVAHAHARECRADVPRGPWRGECKAWDAAPLQCQAHATRGRAGPRRPSPAAACAAPHHARLHPAPYIPQSCSCLGQGIFLGFLSQTLLFAEASAEVGPKASPNLLFQTLSLRCPGPGVPGCRPRE